MSGSSIKKVGKSVGLPKKDLEVLKEFVATKMSMTANYQPVIIRELLNRGGKATKDELALALLLEQPDVVNYWRSILMKWPYKTLVKKHELISYQSKTKTFELLFDLSVLEEVMVVSTMLDLDITKFRKSQPRIGSSVRYKLIEQARGCCQACGSFGTKESPLDIDHIVPQSRARKGKIRTVDGVSIGVNDVENLQVLCMACNRGKRDQGHLNFKPSKERLVEAMTEIIIRAKNQGLDVDSIISSAQESFVQK